MLKSTLKYLVTIMILVLFINVVIDTYKTIQVQNTSVLEKQLTLCKENNFNGWVKVKGSMTTYQCAKSKDV